MSQYLSAEWMGAMQRVAATVPSPEPPPQEALTIEQHVTGAPGGDVTYHLTVDAAGVRVEPGTSPNPTITFTQDYETAAAIARGDLSAQTAFMVGQLRVRGDLPALVANQEVLAGLDDRFAPVRAETTY